MIVLKTGWVEVEQFGICRKRFVVLYGVSSEDGLRIDLPHVFPSELGATFDRELGSWVVGEPDPPTIYSKELGKWIPTTER